MSKLLQHTSAKSQSGFTLVELSIVLVIIGLIISSVLVGQDLVRASELRATVTQYEDYNKAVNTFRLRHDNQFPGDIANAVAYGYAAGTDGDGNGVLTDTLNPTDLTLPAVRDANAGEYVGFWSHLGTTSPAGNEGAGLIAGGYDGNPVAANAAVDNLPEATAGEFWGVFSVSGRNYYILGASDGAGYTTVGTLNPIDALDIDTKIDDNNPSRGVVQARGANGTEPDTGAVDNATGGCIDSGSDPDVYVLATETLICTLRFAMR